MNDAMNSASLGGPELAEPHLGSVLSAAGLDAEYVRAEGNTLYLRDEDGQEIPVLDFVGGFGSLILGHNHPEIIRYAKELLDGQTPVHAQFSRHPYANRAAAVLDRIVRRETGTDEPFYAVFANTGAEAVEAAVKHAEFDRFRKVSALGEEIDAHIEAARAAVRAGEAAVADGAADIEDLIAEVVRHNAGQLSRPPLFLTPEGSFHGKLVGSVQLTHNPAFRVPFKALAAQARFIPLDQPEQIAKVVEGERGVLLDLVTEGGSVTVVERAFPVFCAFVLEPVQGEGGIHVVGEEFAREVQRVCAEIDCPVVVDEIQSGMGRSGAFLASSLVGLRGDYYTLAKSLGGGIAKTSVTLIRESRYCKDFELVHSSTFAKDAFSTLIALKVLELLEAGDGAAYRTVAERGERLREALEEVRAEFPGVVKEVRGRGLMLGVEFHDQSQSASEVIAGVSQAGFLGYTVAGHVLRAHRIRLFPTGSAVNTLRLEPSLYLTDDEIGRLCTALRGACALIRDADGEALVRP
ncbi:aspartate aminotransferase family protein [Streptomyces hiroshimensis]|uniref:Diaminobutyrate--pyruvate aminotransferase n=1 Tax=Streptomyces hiroshimensis TaxID=66424 RepID=A0ABQ2Y3J3_9ACTN|nr:aminotransferase class III-fold pyridoxal phosphate-dependent enzyme [Streptomyces hiroshimensis]GGX61898.1 diaminobutyrate--pyruvate aminotransferase [Streptomyces hiroshimensis]